MKIKIGKVQMKQIKKVDKELKELDGKKVVVGLRGPDEVKEYALYNEFGTVHIPARPFFRTALIFEEGNKKVVDYVRETFSQVMTGKLTSEQAMDKIGLFCKGRVIQSITNGKWEPLDKATIKAKGKSKPLVDTGTMLKSFDYEVRNG